MKLEKEELIKFGAIIVVAVMISCGASFAIYKALDDPVHTYQEGYSYERTNYEYKLYKSDVLYDTWMLSFTAEGDGYVNINLGDAFSACYCHMVFHKGYNEIILPKTYNRPYSVTFFERV